MTSYINLKNLIRTLGFYPRLIVPCTDEEEFSEPNVLLDIDLEKVGQTLDCIAAQLDNDTQLRNPHIWLSIDFEKVKQRIDNITAQLEEVQRKFLS